MVHSVSAQKKPEPDAGAALEPNVGPRESKPGVHTRILAFFALCGVVGGIGSIGHAVYQSARDSVIAPLILSPDNDIVLANKLKMNELQVERTRVMAELESCGEELLAAETAIERLEQLRRTVASGRDWITKLTSRQTQVVEGEIKALEDQKRFLAAMIKKQTALTDKAKADMEAGIISRADYAKETQTLNQMNLALFGNEQERIQSDGLMYEKLLAQKALAGRDGTPAMPEAILRDEQLARIDMELLRLESEKRTKQAYKRALADRVANIDQIAADLRSRPTFRAIEQSLNVAFVPYTQIEGVERGAQIYSCVWGLFFCEAVGTVAEIVPGEVTLPDPWGHPARGQYAVLNLQDHDSAKVKSLRVRLDGDVGRDQHQNTTDTQPSGIASEDQTPPASLRVETSRDVSTMPAAHPEDHSRSNN